MPATRSSSAAAPVTRPAFPDTVSTASASAPSRTSAAAARMSSAGVAVFVPEGNVLAQFLTEGERGRREPIVPAQVHRLGGRERRHTEDVGDVSGRSRPPWCTAVAPIGTWSS